MLLTCSIKFTCSFQSPSFDEENLRFPLTLISKANKKREKTFNTLVIKKLKTTQKQRDSKFKIAKRNITGRVFKTSCISESIFVFLKAMRILTRLFWKSRHMWSWQYFTIYLCNVWKFIIVFDTNHFLLEGFLSSLINKFSK